MEGMFICYVENSMAGQIKSQCFDSDGESFLFFSSIFSRKVFLGKIVS